MADLSKLSNDQLLSLAKERGLSPEKITVAAADAKPKKDVSSLSTAELLKMAEQRGIEPEKFLMPQEQEGLLKKAGRAALEGVVKVGQAVDSVTGAPTRTAIRSMQKGEGLLSAVRRAKAQFGEDPETAPTGKEIAEAEGFSKDRKLFSLPVIGDVSPAGLAGFGIDLVADPTNLIPGTAAIKGAAKTAKATAKGTVSAAKLGGKAALKTAEFAASPLKDTVVGRAAGGVARGTKMALDNVFNPKVADDYKELSDIARKNGIDPSVLPESIEFGETSVISRSARQKREGILGQESLEKFEEGLSSVREATDRKIGQISRGPVLNPVEAGNYIRQSFDEAYDDFFSKIDTSYNQVVKDYPGLRVADSAQEKLNSALNGIEKFAKGRVARGVTDLQEAQGKRLLRAVDAIRSTNGSVKQVVEALRDIGEASFKSQNTLAAIPADVQRMRKLYGDITDAIHETIQTTVQDGQAVSGALRINNKLMTDFFGDKGVLANVIGNRNVAPENVFNSLVMSGDTRKIEALKNILGPERMQQIKGAALNALIKRTDDMDFNFRQVRNAIRNKTNVLSELLDPNEAKEFAEIIKLGDRFGPQVLSSSGTGASNVFKNIKDNIGDAVFNEAFIESLKSRARNANQLQQAAPTPPPASRFQFSMPQRGVTDNALKGLQSVGATANEQERQKRQEIFRRRQKLLEGN